jgi:hypothetical protein
MSYPPTLGARPCYIVPGAVSGAGNFGWVTPFSWFCYGYPAIDFDPLGNPVAVSAALRVGKLRVLVRLTIPQPPPGP